MDYVIEGNEISVDQATKFNEEGYPNYKEWKCEIVDDRFCFDDTWYVLERDTQGNYSYVKYADNKDNKLIEVHVLDNGYAEYKPWDISFKFNNDWSLVQVSKKHQSDVIDWLDGESCEFDSKTITFSKDKTYDWYLANELLRIHKNHQSRAQGLLNLGNGNIYNGALGLTTNDSLKTKCYVRILNDVQNEDVVTFCELVKEYGDNEFVQRMGILFDRDLNLDRNRLVKGKLKDNLLKTPSDPNYGSISDTEKAFFVKDIGSGLNNINTAWVKYSTWEDSHKVVSNVGTVDKDDETNKLDVKWGNSNYIEIDAVDFAPIYKVDEDGNYTTDIIKYQVTVGDGSVQYSVWVNGNYIHFLVNGNRYRINLQSLTVDRLVVSDMQATTVDFSTSYNPTQLRDNLAQNVKTTILNQMVQKVVDSTIPKNEFGVISIEFKRSIGQYLDLFTDSSSLESYVSAWNLDVDSEQCEKFSQVYKNNLEDIDESSIVNGNLYRHLQMHIESAFADPDTGNQRQAILVVDRSSIDVSRVFPAGRGEYDTFTYEVTMDVHIVQNKQWMSKKFNTDPDEYDRRFVIANATIKKMRCYVTFTPSYTSTSGTMTYDVLYEIDKGTSSNPYEVKYNQIVYNYNGKTKLKTIAPEEVVANVYFSDPAAGLLDEDLTYETNGNPFSDITDELLASNIENIFKLGDYTKMFKFINNKVLDTETQVIDNSIVGNPGMEDSIWPISKPIPDQSDLPGELVSVSRGWTYIRGQTYKVDDENLDNQKLVPINGSLEYDIVDVPANKYDTKNVLGVLIATTTGSGSSAKTTYEFKYYKSHETTTVSGQNKVKFTFTDDKSSAKQFDLERNTAYEWREMLFNEYADSEGKITDNNEKVYSRDNFGVFVNRTLLTEYEVKKVASGPTVLIEKNKTFGGEIGKFTLRALGTGRSRDLFLTYNYDTSSNGLPSRFRVKGEVNKDIVVDDLINIEEYERSTRFKDTDEPYAMNYVFKSTSVGFYPVSPWLVEKNGKWTIVGKIIQEYNGYNEIGLGPKLDEGGQFSIEVQLPGTISDTPESQTQTFSFGPEPVERYAKFEDFPLMDDLDPTKRPRSGVLYISTNDDNHYRWQVDENT